MQSGNNSSDLLLVKQWEVYLPPPLNSFRGTVIPRALTKRRRRRKISLEVHKIRVTKEIQPLSSCEGEHHATPRNGLSFPNVKETFKENSNQTFRTYEECIIRILNPSASSSSSALSLSSKNKRKSFDNNDDLDDESSITGSISPEYQSQGNYATPDYQGWKLKLRFPVSAMHMKGWHRSYVIVQIRLGSAKTQLREIIFDSISQAEDFRHELEIQHAHEDIRRQLRMQAQMGDQVLLGDEQLTFLIEIVSGWDLPVADYFTSDPFVKCSFNGKILHETKHIPRTRDPIWTLTSGSLFLWTVSSNELFRGDGLQVYVIDFDKISQDDVLGWLSVPPNILYAAKGERMEFKLQPPPVSNKEDVPGYLAIRCRRASEYDMRFMKEFLDSDNTSSSMDPLGLKNIAKLATESAGGTSNIMSIIRQNTRIVRDRNNMLGTKQYRVRPGPDPKRPNETTWMTKEQIDEESNKDSFAWIDSGSGRLGRLFFEVIGCDNLPNLDAMGFAGNKTDAFVAIVYEDTVVTTDVIDDRLSPRWMPWSKRAFIFHFQHPSSQVFLGVFDYDINLNPADHHDLVGRVSIDLSNLRKDTVYILKYNIYTTAKMSSRKRMGTITVRLRLDIDDERQLLLSALEPPPVMYVNSKKNKDYRVVRYTCTGKYDVERYNIKVINSYIEEILALHHALFFVNDAAIAVILWRATSTISFGFISLKIPIHSITAFVFATLLVELPQFIPSLFLFGLAWILLATMDYRKKLPDVWSRCKSYSELTRALVFGVSGTRPDSIACMENFAETKRFTEAWTRRITESEESAAKAYRESVRIQEELTVEEFDNHDAETSTKHGGLSVDPFKTLLFPIQQHLAMIIRYVRHVKYVIFWEECYISFWVVTICLLLGSIFLFVPWIAMIKLTTRATVWTVFGPWMKLVDVFYVSKIKPSSAEDLAERKFRERKRRHLASSAAIFESRLKLENSIKMKAMKAFMFGKYITRVPILKEDRYRDLPLPESIAVPYSAQRVTLAEQAMQEAGYHRTRLPGQHLVGEMIPMVQSYGFTEAPIGQATAHPRLVDSMGPGRGITYSTVTAYVKVGSVIVIAAVVTWICVPVLAATTETLIRWLIGRREDGIFG